MLSESARHTDFWQVEYSIFYHFVGGVTILYMLMEKMQSGLKGENING